MDTSAKGEWGALTGMEASAWEKGRGVCASHTKVAGMETSAGVEGGEVCAPHTGAAGMETSAVGEKGSTEHAGSTGTRTADEEDGGSILPTKFDGSENSGKGEKGG